MIVRSVSVSMGCDEDECDVWESIGGLDYQEVWRKFQKRGWRFDRGKGAAICPLHKKKIARNKPEETKK